MKTLLWFQVRFVAAAQSRSTIRRRRSKKLKCSVLTMNGERDRQVPTENLIKTAVALELMSQWILRHAKQNGLPNTYSHDSRLFIQLLDVVAEVLDDAGAPHLHRGGQFPFLNRKFAR